MAPPATPSRRPRTATGTLFAPPPHERREPALTEQAITAPAVPTAVTQTRNTRCTTCGEPFVDTVTGTLFRHTWDRRAACTLADARRARRPLALILADVDRFKTINDTYGHPAGDAVLRAIADVLRSGSGDAGLVGRYGGCAGDEFLILLPDLDLNRALVMARRMRDRVRGLTVDVRTQRNVCVSLTGQTISMGIAVAADLPPGTLAELLLDCDAALRQAKQSGGDQVRVALPHVGTPAAATDPRPLDRHGVGVRLMLAPDHCLPRTAERELALSPLGVEHVYTVLSTLLNRCTAPLTDTP
ncbi:GGDEF domain-containing protein [Streptomyces sp. NBC_00079]|uniref:GGDEF domain-containing protein n=1 Tax=Streptomyces sp. NBC_00079 TaxID=2975644 RepID=UPI0032472F09